MELSAVWTQLSLGLGILFCCIEALPMDMDTIKMAAMNVGGAMLDAAQDINPQAAFDHEVSYGEFSSKTGAAASARNFAESDERKRRRRSLNDVELALPSTLSEEHRHKRSPCGRRRAQSTPAPANNATNAAGAGAAGAEGNNPDDLPRRKRSPDENEIDENNDVIPDQHNLGERAQEICEKMRQAMSNALDAMAGMFENLTKSLKEKFSDRQQPQTDAM